MRPISRVHCPETNLDSGWPRYASINRPIQEPQMMDFFLRHLQFRMEQSVFTSSKKFSSEAVLVNLDTES